MGGDTWRRALPGRENGHGIPGRGNTPGHQHGNGKSRHPGGVLLGERGCVGDLLGLTAKECWKVDAA